MVCDGRLQLQKALAHSRGGDVRGRARKTISSLSQKESSKFIFSGLQEDQTTPLELGEGVPGRSPRAEGGKKRAPPGQVLPPDLRSL